MERTEEFSDERNKSWCIHCGKWLIDVEVNEDHVPTKGLLQKPWPHHLPKVTVCTRCNSSFSLDEQYFVSFLSAVLSGSTNPGEQSLESAGRALTRATKLRERIENAKTTYQTIGGSTRTVWKPEIERINRVVVKNARGHAYYEFGEPMLNDPGHVWAFPMEGLTEQQRSSFEGDEPGIDAYPEVGSRMLARLYEGQDLMGKWVIVQEGRYRYAVQQADGIRVQSVIAEYLATEVHWHN